MSSSFSFAAPTNECICDYDEHLLVQCQIQDPVIFWYSILAEGWLLDNTATERSPSDAAKVQLVMLGGGAFTNSFPDTRETAKSSDAGIAEFEDACQTGVSAFAPINVHAKL